MCNKYNEKVYDSAHFAGLYDKLLAIYRQFCYNEPKNDNGLLNISDDINKNRIIPVPTLFFYAAAVRIIQQTAYLYGERDFWDSDDSDKEKTISRLY